MMKSRHKAQMIKLKFPTARISENLQLVSGFVAVVAVNEGWLLAAGELS